MTIRSRFSRFVGQVTLLAGGLLLAGLSLVLIEEFTGGRKDSRAHAAADAATAAYKDKFAIGEPLEHIESALGAGKANTLRRGADVLIVVQEGRQLWYCSHNYFGTALRFQEGKLQQIATEQWPETCL